jgi:hypothetical protein
MRVCDYEHVYFPYESVYERAIPYNNSLNEQSKRAVGRERHAVPTASSGVSLSWPSSTTLEVRSPSPTCLRQQSSHSLCYAIQYSEYKSRVDPRRDPLPLIDIAVRLCRGSHGCLASMFHTRASMSMAVRELVT